MPGPVATFATPSVIVDGATQTIDCASNSYFTWTLGASRTVSTFLNPAPGQVIYLEVTQDATGSRILTWPSNVVWPGINNGAPTLRTQAASLDILRFTYNPTAAVWRGELLQPQPANASKFVTQASAGPTTMSAGDITGANQVFYQTTNSAPGTVTTRTATQLYADDPNAFIGKTWIVTANNTGAGTLTLAGGTGVTITGTATVAQNITRTYSCIFSSATAMTMQLVSVGSVS